MGFLTGDFIREMERYANRRGAPRRSISTFAASDAIARVLFLDFEHHATAHSFAGAVAGASTTGGAVEVARAVFDHPA
jgi:hypothetical protein